MRFGAERMTSSMSADLADSYTTRTAPITVADRPSGSEIGEIGFSITGSDIRTVSFLSTGTGTYDPYAYFDYTTNGSDLNFGGYLSAFTNGNGVTRWTLNRPSTAGYRVVLVNFVDDGDDTNRPFTDTAYNGYANGIGIVPQRGVFEDCGAFGP
jgi:hypothetical protein